MPDDKHRPRDTPPRERRPGEDSLIEKGGKVWERPARPMPDPSNRNPPPPPPPAEKKD